MSKMIKNISKQGLNPGNIFANSEHMTFGAA